MTDALSSPNAKPAGKLQRPPVSGPGSDTEKWRAFVKQETGRTDLDRKSRDELIEILEHKGEETELRTPPDSVDLLDPVTDSKGRERAPRIDGGNGPQWAVPVEGGYVAEDELVQAEREVETERRLERHDDRLKQLKQRAR